MDPCTVREPIQKECHNNCTKKWEEYQACGKRIEADTDGGKAHCEPQFFEYLHCVDACVAPKLFAKLKYNEKQSQEKFKSSNKK